MLQKNPIDFLWSSVTRCLPEDVLLQIFGKHILYIYIYTRTYPKYVWGIQLRIFATSYWGMFEAIGQNLFWEIASEVPPIWPGEKNIWATCPKRCVYNFFRREMYSLFWVEILLADAKFSTRFLEDIPQCFPRKLQMISVVKNISKHSFGDSLWNIFWDIAQQILWNKPKECPNSNNMMGGFCGLDLHGWDMSTIHATLAPRRRLGDKFKAGLAEPSKELECSSVPLRDKCKESSAEPCTEPFLKQKPFAQNTAGDCETNGENRLGNASKNLLLPRTQEDKHVILPQGLY